jgi:hypothetical protein
MTDIKAKILNFGARLKSDEQYSTARVRPSDIKTIKDYLVKKGLSMTTTDAITFAVQVTYGGK